MRFTDLFLRRPVLAIVVNLIIIIAGVQAVRTLNVRQYPKLESASISVTTVYVGANAELVRGFITTPLERVGGHQRTRRPSARRFAARGASSGDQHSAVGRANRLDVHGIRLDDLG